MPNQLEEISCAVCHEQNSKPRYHKQGYTIVECITCGFAYVNPRLAKKELYHLYTQDYFQNQEVGYEDYELTAHLRKATFEKWIQNFEPYLNTTPKRVLDIGCANGYFLELMQRKGCIVKGIELDAHAQEHLRRKNIPFFDKPLEYYQPTEKYDLITLFDVLEHLPEVDKSLSHLKSLLNPGGKIVLITPNYGSFQRKLRGKNWFQFKPQEHIHYFSAQTLRTLALKAELQVKHLSHAGQYADKSFLQSRLSRYKLNFASPLLYFIPKDKLLYLDTSSLFAILEHRS